MILLLQLILAHFLGDFLLQPVSWVKAKEDRKIKAWPLYFHVLIHGCLIMFFVNDLRFWPWALLLTVVHFIIDTLKLYLQTKKTQRLAFLGDQAAHILSILLIWACKEKISVNPGDLNIGFLLLLITSVYFLTQPVSIAIAIIISKWTPQTGENTDDSLQSAGKYIGYLERLLVFIFLCSNHWEAIGFLITAKSVFRFGDLKAARDRKLTEYVLIGTLLSFGIAIIAGLLFNQLAGIL